MKSKITIVVALLVIAAVTYWAVDLLRPRTYVGSNLTFPIANGHAVVTNQGGETIPVEMRTAGRVASFRVQSPELELSQSSARQGTGRSAYHALTFDLPPGQATINITRGSDVQFIADSSGTIHAVVTPRNAENTRTIAIAAGVVNLIALYYISSAVGHRWIGWVRRKLTFRNVQEEHSTT